jgi:hypothetical protein
MAAGGDEAETTAERFDETGPARPELREDGADARGGRGRELDLRRPELGREGAGADPPESPVDRLLRHERQRIDEDELLLHPDRRAAALVETLPERLLELRGASRMLTRHGGELPRPGLSPEASEPSCSPNHPGGPPLVAVPPIAAAKT